MDPSSLNFHVNAPSVELDAQSIAVPVTIVPSGTISPSAAQVLYAYIHYSFTGQYAAPPPPGPVSPQTIIGLMETAIDVLAASAASNPGLAAAAAAEMARLQTQLEDRDAINVLSAKRGCHERVDAALRDLVQMYHDSLDRAHLLRSWITPENATSVALALSEGLLMVREDLNAVLNREAHDVAVIREKDEQLAEMQQLMQTGAAELNECNMALTAIQEELQLTRLERDGQAESYKATVDSQTVQLEELTQMNTQLQQELLSTSTETETIKTAVNEAQAEMAALQAKFKMMEYEVEKARLEALALVEASLHHEKKDEGEHSDDSAIEVDADDAQHHFDFAPEPAAVETADATVKAEEAAVKEPEIKPELAIAIADVTESTCDSEGEPHEHFDAAAEETEAKQLSEEVAAAEEPVVGTEEPRTTSEDPTTTSEEPAATSEAPTATIEEHTAAPEETTDIAPPIPPRNRDPKPEGLELPALEPAATDESDFEVVSLRPKRASLPPSAASPAPVQPSPDATSPSADDADAAPPQPTSEPALTRSPEMLPHDDPSADISVPTYTFGGSSGPRESPPPASGRRVPRLTRATTQVSAVTKPVYLATGISPPERPALPPRAETMHGELAPQGVMSPTASSAGASSYWNIFQRDPRPEAATAALTQSSVVAHTGSSAGSSGRDSSDDAEAKTATAATTAAAAVAAAAAGSGKKRTKQRRLSSWLTAGKSDRAEEVVVPEEGQAQAQGLSQSQSSVAEVRTGWSPWS